MKKEVTEMVFILDRSGSMGGLESDTIGGFNSLLKKQKNTKGKAIVSTVLFDDRVEILHDRENVRNIQPITEKEYYVRGGTALLDDLGGAVEHIRAMQKKMDKKERPVKTIFVIMTDGLENASTRYRYDKVKELVEREQRKHGWKILFLGANMDAIAEAAKMGIRASHTITFLNDTEGTKLNYCTVSTALSDMREAEELEEACLPSDWKAGIEKDVRRCREFT